VDSCSLHFFFGVDTFPLQNVGVHVVKVWSAFNLTLNVNPLDGGMLQHNYLHVIYQNDLKILENVNKALLKPFGKQCCL
jgi:hypothetical protein